MQSILPDNINEDHHEQFQSNFIEELRLPPFFYKGFDEDFKNALQDDTCLETNVEHIFNKIQIERVQCCTKENKRKICLKEISQADERSHADILDYICESCTKTNGFYCVNCFVQENHPFHKFRRGTKMSGYCDCGNQESLEAMPFCNQHKLSFDGINEPVLSVKDLNETENSFKNKYANLLYLIFYLIAQKNLYIQRLIQENNTREEELKKNTTHEVTDNLDIVLQGVSHNLHRKIINFSTQIVAKLQKENVDNIRINKITSIILLNQDVVERHSQEVHSFYQDQLNKKSFNFLSLFFFLHKEDQISLVFVKICVFLQNVDNFRKKIIVSYIKQYNRNRLLVSSELRALSCQFLPSQSTILKLIKSKEINQPLTYKYDESVEGLLALQDLFYKYATYFIDLKYLLTIPYLKLHVNTKNYSFFQICSYSQKYNSISQGSKNRQYYDLEETYLEDIALGIAKVLFTANKNQQPDAIRILSQILQQLASFLENQPSNDQRIYLPEQRTFTLMTFLYFYHFQPANEHSFMNFQKQNSAAIESYMHLVAGNDTQNWKRFFQKLLNNLFIFYRILAKEISETKKLRDLGKPATKKNIVSYYYEEKGIMMTLDQCLIRIIFSLEQFFIKHDSFPFHMNLTSKYQYEIKHDFTDEKERIENLSESAASEISLKIEEYIYYFEILIEPFLSIYPQFILTEMISKPSQKFKKIFQKIINFHLEQNQQILYYFSFSKRLERSKSRKKHQEFSRMSIEFIPNQIRQEARLNKDFYDKIQAIQNITQIGGFFANLGEQNKSLNQASYVLYAELLLKIARIFKLKEEGYQAQIKISNKRDLKFMPPSIQNNLNKRFQNSFLDQSSYHHPTVSLDNEFSEEKDPEFQNSNMEEFFLLAQMTTNAERQRNLQRSISEIQEDPKGENQSEVKSDEEEGHGEESKEAKSEGSKEVKSEESKDIQDENKSQQREIKSNQVSRKNDEQKEVKRTGILPPPKKLN